MKFSEKRLNKIIKESIDNFLKEGVVDTFTDYTPKQAEINKAAIGRVGNPSYDNAKKADTAAKPTHYKSLQDWRENYKPKGVTWTQYMNM